jgi:membrane dipeptidase
MLTTLFDAHLDLAYNALGYDRDLTCPLSEIRLREAALYQTEEVDPSAPACQEHWGTPTVSLPAMRDANIRMCLVTLLARNSQAKIASHAPRRFDLDYAAPAITEAAAMGQLSYYKRLQIQGHIKLVCCRSELEAICSAPNGPIGCILSMEGCDPIVDPEDVQLWWQRGLRTACLAHYGQGRYAFGTGGNGPLTACGRQLLHQFQSRGLILDLVHTAEQAFFESLDLYDGPMYVSHANCRALVPSDRQLSDEQLQCIIHRDGVIGVVLDAWMLLPGYDRRSTPRHDVSLHHLADHIDHICQLSGNCCHVGIGSDLDGGFGVEQCPKEIESISDLQQLADILAQRGYVPNDINAIFHGNWLRFFREHLPT